MLVPLSRASPAASGPLLTWFVADSGAGPSPGASPELPPPRKERSRLMAELAFRERDSVSWAEGAGTVGPSFMLRRRSAMPPTRFLVVIPSIEALGAPPVIVAWTVWRGAPCW